MTAQFQLLAVVAGTVITTGGGLLIWLAKGRFEELLSDVKAIKGELPRLASEVRSIAERHEALRDNFTVAERKNYVCRKRMQNLTILHPELETPNHPKGFADDD